MTMPHQKPHRSKQDYSTPPEVLAAVKNRLGIREFALDVAATEENKVCPAFCKDGLLEPWSTRGWNWCNPPFGDIEPWVMKAREEIFRGAQTAVLVPASVGSNWWAIWVDGRAHVWFMNGRIRFVGATGPYPKDTAILLFTSVARGGYEIWDWKGDV